MLNNPSSLAPTPVSRSKHFGQIQNALEPVSVGSGSDYVVALGDSLELLKMIPSSSISLIAVDPPYHSTKKANIYGDKAFAEDEHFLDWMEAFAQEWKRILKTNGTLYLFCSSQMSARLEVRLSTFFRPLNMITWTKPNSPGYDGWKGKMKKENLRNWYPHSERIIMFEHGTYGRRSATRRSPLGQYIKDCRLQAGLSGHALTEMTGEYGKVNHGGAVANWEAGRYVPSREQWHKICEAITSTGRVSEMLPYEDIVRPMNLSSGMEFTDVWNFESVKPFQGKHPAEKPIDMMRHIVRSSSYKGDIVLDCFAGSGSTGAAALLEGRRAVCIDIEEQWAQRAARELEGVSLTAKVEDEEHQSVRAPHMRNQQFGEDLFTLGIDLLD